MQRGFAYYDITSASLSTQRFSSIYMYNIKGGLYMTIIPNDYEFGQTMIRLLGTKDSIHTLEKNPPFRKWFCCNAFSYRYHCNSVSITGIVVLRIRIYQFSSIVCKRLYNFWCFMVFCSICGFCSVFSFIFLFLFFYCIYPPCYSISFWISNDFLKSVRIASSHT